VLSKYLDFYMGGTLYATKLTDFLKRATLHGHALNFLSKLSPRRAECPRVLPALLVGGCQPL
jgi:hypothetical protein